MNRLTLEIATQYTPFVAMFAAAWNKKKEAAPKVDLSGRYSPDRKKWLGPNTADSYVSDYLTGDYPGDYGWDSAGPASPSSISSCAYACCFVSWLLQCCPPRSCACLLHCRCFAMPCPLPRRYNGPALQLPLPPKHGWPVSPVLWVLRHAVGHLRQPRDPRDGARQEPPVGARCPVTPVDGMISGYDYDYDYVGCARVYTCSCVCGAGVTYLAIGVPKVSIFFCCL